jgi:nitroreductase
MDALEALKTRRAVRVYRPDPVPRSVLENVVDCARLAATAINLQPWEFVVVTERPRLHALAAATDHGKFIADTPACVVVLCKDVKYFLEDGSAATQNLMVAARAQGLGSCWVAGEKKAYATEILRLVDAPPGYRLVSLVPLGYPAEEPAPAKRPLGEVLHWERF